ncbi:MAG: pentapeptide repeat-containing protein, partial [Leptolyngbyaceae cyanobacterium SM1_3_5]|nr:pentapeptide repeat-containing protein [Leptolyngbyaceae cyanobacterium SM1_3_5]
GGYAEDRQYGVRVIDLGVMLAVANLVGTDLRWTDLSDANLIRANLSRCDLVKTNLARTILYEGDLSGSDLMGTRLFYGSVETASPRSRTDLPDYKTGAFTGAVIENADFSNVIRLSDEQRQYCCAWGGAATRSTIPGGCEGIPNRLGR